MRVAYDVMRRRYYERSAQGSRNPDSLKLQLQFIESQVDSKTGLLPNSVNHYGDWCALVPQGGCPHKSGLISSYQWAKQCELFAEMADEIGNSADAAAYSSKAQAAKQAIYNNYWDSSKQ